MVCENRANLLTLFRHQEITMKRLTCFAAGLGLLLAAGLTVRGDEARGDKVEYEVHAKGYFEKNTSGLKGDSSYLFLTDDKAFDAVFGVGVTMGTKPNLLPKDAFEKKAVAAVIKRGNAVTDYEVEKVTDDKETLYVQYKAKTGTAGTAKYASPLIVSVPRGKYTSVVFIENGKTVETVKVGDK